MYVNDIVILVLDTFNVSEVKSVVTLLNNTVFAVSLDLQLVSYYLQYYNQAFVFALSH